MHWVALALCMIGVVALRKSEGFATTPSPILWVAGCVLILVSGVIFGRGIFGR